MTASVAHSDHLYLGHFDLNLAVLTVADLDLKWEKSSLDRSRYQLVSRSQSLPYSAWKSGSSWGTMTGSTAATLKKAKEIEEMRLKADIMEELSGLERYLRAYDVHRKAIFEVKGEEFDDDQRFHLSSVAYRALRVILTRLMANRVKVGLSRFPSIAACKTDSVLGSAITGFDLGDLKLMFVEPCIKHSWTQDPAKRYAISGKSIEMPVNTLVNSSTVMESHPGFCDYKALHVTRLSENALIRQLDAYIEQTFRVAQAVSG